MKKQLLILSLLFFGITGIYAQNDTMYVHQQGGIVSKYAVDLIDSITFYADTTAASFTCGDNITFIYNGSPVTYGTVLSSGKCWLDRNLGASQVATSSTDTAAYGDLFQWGRDADGHQVRSPLSDTTSTLSVSDIPGHGNFIFAPNAPNDWRTPQNPNLWQGLIGINNTCPPGWRLPTDAEWEAERASWSSNNAAGAFASPLKLPVAGYRDYSDGSLGNVGSVGGYWSSTVDGTFSRNLYFTSINAGMNSGNRANGVSVRCLKDNAPCAIALTSVAGSDSQTLYIGSAITEITYSTYGVTGIGTPTGLPSGVTASWATDVITINGIPTDTGTFNYTIPLTGGCGSLSASGTITVNHNPCDTITSVTFNYNGLQVTYGTVISSGRCWLDRNLGATQVATSSTDTAAYGDLFQWGRDADGHQVRSPLSGTTSTLSVSDIPGHSNFILAPNAPFDWRSPQNDSLWQGINGINNPCPSGWRLPTETEWEAERASWSSNNAAGAFASPLKLPVAGYRYYSNGSLDLVGSYGFYWSSTVDGAYSWGLNLYFGSSNAGMGSDARADGSSVRCLKE